MEIGIGIHGEPGRHRVPLESADRITDHLLDAVTADLRLRPGERVLLLVNGMGGTPLSELYIVYRKLAEILARRGIRVQRNLIGPYITSLEMQGISITLLKTDDEINRVDNG